MLEWYLRKNDPFAPVYEIDTEANTWKLAASRIGVDDGLGGDMPDGGARFRGDGFERVWPKTDHGNGTITYTRDPPPADTPSPIPSSTSREPTS